MLFFHFFHIFSVFTVSAGFSPCPSLYLYYCINPYIHIQKGENRDSGKLILSGVPVSFPYWFNVSFPVCAFTCDVLSPSSGGGLFHRLYLFIHRFRAFKNIAVRTDISPDSKHFHRCPHICVHFIGHRNHFIGSPVGKNFLQCHHIDVLLNTKNPSMINMIYHGRILSAVPP